MPNRHRGEILAELDGRPRTLVLTLGALAELEAAFGADDLVALAERFERGRLSARDAVRILAAGLRGAGEDVTDDEVAGMRTPGAAAGFARIVGELISATFGGAPEEGGGGDGPNRPVGGSGLSGEPQRAPVPPVGAPGARADPSPAAPAPPGPP